MTTQCLLTLTTDATGALSGTLDIRTVPGVASGTFASQNNVVSLHLHAVGQNPPNVQSDIDVQLSGTSQFIGTATSDGESRLATMDVSAAAPLLVTFDFDITVDPQGTIVGAGTATGCGVQVPVNITGSNGPSNCSLHIVGANLASFTWDGAGPPTDTGFTADWTGNGFGASASETGLAIVAPSPSPTPTASPSPSFPPSPSPTPTATPTAIATATATATTPPTSPSPTATLAPSPTPTPTTPPSSATPTATATTTITPTATIAATPVPPRARKATNVTADSFTTNWTAVSTATGYRLDVSTIRSFGNYVSGYQNLDVGNVTNRTVSGLAANTYYYYRLRAYNGNGTSRNSNIIRVKTASH